MKKLFLFVLPLSGFLLSCTVNSSFSEKDMGVVRYINPIIGASTSQEAGKSGHGLGKTFPGSATPFGLVQLSPDTKTGGDNGPGYSWHHKTIEGFSFIHMSGIGWYGEFGNFLVIPNTGKLHTAVGDERQPETGYRSRYSHDTEVALAGYYAVDLDDYGIRTELTSAPHAGIIRMTFPKSDSARVSIDLARRIGGSASEQYIKQVDEHTIEGWMRCSSVDGGWGNGDGNVNYTVYFYCQLDKPMKNTGIWSATIPERFTRRNLQTIQSKDYKEAVADAEVFYGRKEMQGKHLGFFTEFATEENEQVLLKAGISFVSVEGAKANLKAEIPKWDFNRVRKENNDLWKKAFGNIAVKGGSEDEKTIFYTALYHTMIDPRSTSDVTGEYVGGDAEIHKSDAFVYRTIFSGWDVFRSQFPLQTIINPRMVNDEVNSLVRLAELSGKEYLERWEIMNSYSGCMIGNPAVSVILDAYRKNIREWDQEKAFQYCLNSVNKFGNGELGYVPYSISKTLEYAYSDWCVGEFAGLLGKKELSEAYLQKSLHYKNIWNDTLQWFCGKKPDGMFGEWRGETCHDLYCVESNPLQQGWFVPHDVYGFMDFMGHRKFTDKLTAFFDNSPDDFLWNDYYNHPNEPVHHVPFMFAYTGNSWLTQKWTRKICANAYGTDVMGLCGNEDVGQMSAWYILAAMGLHPINPGDNIYILTSPVFEEITIRLDPDFYEGKSFTIKAVNNSPENIYIQQASLNGKPLDRAWINHEELARGGELEMVMGPEPNYQFGADNLPPSFGRNRWVME